MSQFSFYPFLFYSQCQQPQFRPNLHSIYFLPHSQSQIQSFPYFPTQTQNIQNFQVNLKGPSQSYVNPRGFTDDPSQQRISFLSTNKIKLGDPSKFKKEQTTIKEEGTLISQEHRPISVPLKSKEKNTKISKTKKLSKKEKKERQLKRNSVENSKRNIIPNQIHQMLSIVFKKQRSNHLVEKLLSKYYSKQEESQLSVQRFYLYQSLLKEKISHYANEQSLMYLLKPLEPDFTIYTREQQEIYMKIGLTLISYFMRYQSTLIILNSQRIKSSNKLDHLRIKRYLQNFLQEIIAGNLDPSRTLPKKLKQQQVQN